ncbi:NAD(P)-dependent oxidoreductase [Weissella fangxianensis]|uniref:NAD(P)-dependent oxidoreductase n=1 Tax=Weissella fangxianensis TaxID=2953879 RepID=UPI0021585762|nr:NAD(P)H-binding protein [Weissella fangxianensis]
MQITIFGASGKTGRLVVQQALRRGYQFVAYVRDATKLSFTDANLKVVQGQLDELDKIKQAVTGSQAVLSALGPTGKKESDQQISSGMANIVNALDALEIKRFIVLSTTSSQDPHDIDSMKFKLRRGMIRIGRPSAYEAIVKYTALVRQSKSDWTLLRIASLLTNASLTKNVQVGYLGRDKFKAKLSRANLAWFMLEQIDSTEFICQAPAISD